MQSYRTGSAGIMLAALLCTTQPAAAATVTAQTGSVFNQPALWAEDDGEQVQLSKWSGTPVIMAMAYTECTRICNATLHRLEEAQAFADKTNTKVEFVIFSFDPSIDNPASWTYYRRQHNLVNRSNWHFLTGSKADTKRIANQLGIEYWMDEDHVMHDLRIVFVNPDGHIKTFLDWDHQVVADLFK